MWESLKPPCIKCYCFTVIIAVPCNLSLESERKTSQIWAPHVWGWTLRGAKQPLLLLHTSGIGVFLNVAVFLPHIFRPKLHVILRLEHGRAVLVRSVLGGLFIFSFCPSQVLSITWRRQRKHEYEVSVYCGFDLFQEGNKSCVDAPCL